MDREQWLHGGGGGGGGGGGAMRCYVRLEEEGMEPGLIASSTVFWALTCCIVMLVHPFWQ